MTLNLNPDRAFDPDPAIRALARDLHAQVRDLPLVCPHGHVDPRLLGDPEASFGSPADLLIIPDHYVTRMLYSQGIALEALGVPRLDGGPVETDHRQVWRLFADNYHLFRGTPTGYWLNDELADVFGVDEKLSPETADAIYDQIAARLMDPAYRHRALFERFNIEVLCTTDGPADLLEWHRKLLDDGWGVNSATGQPRAAHLPPRWRGQPRPARLARPARPAERCVGAGDHLLPVAVGCAERPARVLREDGRTRDRSRRARPRTPGH